MTRTRPILNQETRRFHSRLLVCSLALWTVCTSAFAESYHVPFFMAADHSLSSLLRVTWPSCRTRPELTIRALDDSGEEYGPIEIPWRAGPKGCGRILEFNSKDLENGNGGKGVLEGIGGGEGHWQLFIDSTSPVHVMSYVRLPNGLLSPMHETVPFWEDRNGYFVGTFNPGSTTFQRSWLRIINPYPHELSITISGQDNITVGSSYGSHWITLEPFEVLTVDAQTLETKNDEWSRSFYTGRLGDGTQEGRWRLYFRANTGLGTEWKNLVVLSLMQSPAGYLLNMSPIPGLSPGGGPDDDFTPKAPSQFEDTEGDDDEFNMQFVFDNNITPAIQTSFEKSAKRWEKIIVGDLPNATNQSFAVNSCRNRRAVTLDIDDLLIFVKLGSLGGRSGPVGRANICRDIDSGNFRSRPIAGWIVVNKDASSDNWRTTSPLSDAIFAHEIGHVLAFTKKVLWKSGYIRLSPSRHFVGPQTLAAFSRQGGSRYSGYSVPLASDGSHWHEDLSGEIMYSGVGKNSPISQITVGVLADLGYEVDFGKAEFWYRNVFN